MIAQFIERDGRSGEPFVHQHRTVRDRVVKLGPDATGVKVGDVLDRLFSEFCVGK